MSGAPARAATTGVLAPALLRGDPLRELAAELQVRLITGSAPPDLCGVGAYTAGLADALRALGADVEVQLQRRGDRLGEVIAGQPAGAIVHLQYPTVGIGASFGPLAGLVRRRGVVLTQHEFSYAHPLRRAMAVGLGRTAGHVIVSNTTEQRRLGRWIGHKALTVLPVPANIPVGMVAAPRTYRAATTSPAHPKRPYTVGWFGIVRPDQGLERFLGLAELAHREDEHVRFVVIGAHHPADAPAIAKLQRRTAHLRLRWTGELDDAGVSRELSGLDAAYLPYPDGVSERRASAVAMFGHGVPVAAPLGASTPAHWRGCVLPAASPREAWERLVAWDQAKLDELTQRAREAVAGRTMARLAEQHIAIYQGVIGRGRPRGVGRRADSMT